jgi:hypothetical protein
MSRMGDATNRYGNPDFACGHCDKPVGFPVTGEDTACGWFCNAECYAAWKQNVTFSVIVAESDPWTGAGFVEAIPRFTEETDR